MKFIKANYLILLILGLSLFVRLYRLPATMTFLEDEGRDMLIVKKMWDTGRPVLLGPQTSTGNMYLGPLYYYFITPALVLAGMDPVGPAALIALTGAATVYLIYLLARKWYGHGPAVVAALLYAVLPMLVLFTRNSWNPNLVPLSVILSLWLADRILLHPEPFSTKHWLGFGAVIGLMVQLHYMILIFIGWFGLVIFARYIQDWRKLVRGVLFAIVGFVIMLSPFLVFEIRNDWVNSRALLRFVTAQDNKTMRYELPFWLWESKVVKTSETGIANILGKNFFISDPAASYITAAFLALIIAIILLAEKPKRMSQILPAILVLGPILSLGIYQENIHPHYLGFLFALVPLIFASGLSQKYLRWPTAAFAIFAILWTAPTLWSYLNSGPTIQAEKAEKVAAYIESQAAGRPYNVISRSGTFTTPYQYYLSLMANRPSNVLQETVFLICQDSECTSSDVSTTLLFLAGPAHPTLVAYLGHPAVNEFTNSRELVRMEHAMGGVWVAQIRVTK